MNRDILFPCDGIVCRTNIFIHDEEFYEYFDRKHHRTGKIIACHSCLEWFEKEVLAFTPPEKEEK